MCILKYNVWYFKQEKKEGISCHNDVLIHCIDVLEKMEQEHSSMYSYYY